MKTGLLDFVNQSMHDAFPGVLKQAQPCEQDGCSETVVADDYCEEHHTHHYCECGRALETPGDGLCRRCD